MSASFTKNCKVYVQKKPTVVEKAPQEKVEEAPKQNVAKIPTQIAQTNNTKRVQRKFYQVKKQPSGTPPKAFSHENMEEREESQSFKLDAQPKKLTYRHSFSEEKPRISTATTKEKSDDYLESEEENQDVDQQLEHKYGRRYQNDVREQEFRAILFSKRDNYRVEEEEQEFEDEPLWGEDDVQEIRQGSEKLKNSADFAIPLKLKEQLSENCIDKQRKDATLNYRMTGSCRSLDSNYEGESIPQELLSTKDSSELRSELGPNSSMKIDGVSPQQQPSHCATSKKNFKKANVTVFSPVFGEQREPKQSTYTDNRPQQPMGATLKTSQPVQSLQSARVLAAHARPVPQKVAVKPDFRMIFIQLKQTLGLDVRPFHILTSNTNHESWYYVDQQGIVQGPFTSTEMDLWYFEEYFKDDLLISFPDRNNFRPLTYYLDLSIKITNQIYQSRAPPESSQHRLAHQQLARSPSGDSPYSLDRTSFLQPNREIAPALRFEQRSDSLPIDMQLSYSGQMKSRAQSSFLGLSTQYSPSPPTDETSYFTPVSVKESFYTCSKEMQRGFYPLSPEKASHL